MREFFYQNSLGKMAAPWRHVQLYCSQYAALSHKLPRMLVLRPLKTKQTAARGLVVYKWPGMRYLQMFSRVKFAQAAVAMFSMIPLSKGYLEGSVQGDTLALAGTAATVLSGVFFGVSAFLQRFIGQMSFSSNHESDKLIVSTVNFWGRRSDVAVDVEAIVPFADSNSPRSSFNRLEVEGVRKPYLYSLRYGQVLDPGLLRVIEGDNGRHTGDSSNRTHTGDCDNRTHTVEANNRTHTVEANNRTHTGRQ